MTPAGGVSLARDRHTAESHQRFRDFRNWSPAASMPESFFDALIYDEVLEKLPREDLNKRAPSNEHETQDTLLCRAARLNLTSCMELLLYRGADIEARCKNGWTALMVGRGPAPSAVACPQSLPSPVPPRAPSRPFPARGFGMVLSGGGLEKINKF